MLDRNRMTGKTSSASQINFRSLNHDWSQSISEILLMHTNLNNSLFESLTKAGKLILDEVLPSRNLQQKKDSLEDTLWNWVQEFMYHSNSLRIGVRNTLEDLKHIFEDHKVNKLYVEKACQVLESYPQQMKVSATPEALIKDYSNLLSTIGSYYQEYDCQNRKSVLNLDPEPYSRTRGMQKLEICQLYKTNYGYLAPRVKNPLFFGETRLEEMRQKVLKLEGEIANHNLIITSLRRDYQLVEQRMAQLSLVSEQKQSSLEHDNKQLWFKNNELLEQLASLQSSIENFQNINRVPLQKKETTRSRLTTRSSMRGAYSQPPQRGNTMEDGRDFMDKYHQDSPETIRAREYFEIVPSDADKSYHSSRDHVSQTLKQIHTLRELVLKERKVREELETRLIEKEFFVNSQQTGDFNNQIELEDQTLMKLHQTKIKYEEQIHHLRTELSRVQVDYERQIESLNNLVSQERSNSSALRNNVHLIQTQLSNQSATATSLQMELDQALQDLRKTQANLASLKQSYTALVVSSVHSNPVRNSPLKFQQNQSSCPPSPLSGPDKRSISATSPLAQNRQIFDLSLQEQLFQTHGTCDVCAAGSGKFRRNLTYLEAVQDLKSKLQARRHEIAIMQERELSKQKAHHAEIHLLNESSARDKAELQHKISMLQMDVKQQQEELERSKADSQTQISNSSNLITAHAKIKSLQYNLLSTETELSSCKAEITQLQQALASVRLRNSELENRTADWINEKLSLEGKLTSLADEHQMLVDGEKQELMTQLRLCTSKSNQLEKLITYSERKELESAQQIRALEDKLQEAEELTGINLRRNALHKENLKFAISKVSDRIRRELTERMTNFQEEESRKLRYLEGKISALSKEVVKLKGISEALKHSKRDQDSKLKHVVSTHITESDELRKGLARDSESQERALSELSQQNLHLSQQVASLMTRMAAQQGEYSRLLTSLTQQKDTETLRIAARLEEVEQSAYSLTTLLAEQKIKAEEEKNAVQKAKKELTYCMEEKDELENMILKLRLEEQETKNLTEREFSLEKKKWHQEVESLKQQIEREAFRMHAEVKHLGDKLKETTSQKKLLEDKVLGLDSIQKKEVNSLQEKYKSDLERYKSELQTKTEAISILQTKLDNIVLEQSHANNLADLAKSSLQDQLTLEQQKVIKLQMNLQSKVEEWTTEKNRLLHKQTDLEKSYQEELFRIEKKLKQSMKECSDYCLKVQGIETELRKKMDAIESLEQDLIASKCREHNLLKEISEIDSKLQSLNQDIKSMGHKLWEVERSSADNQKVFTLKESENQNKISLLEAEISSRSKEFEDKLRLTQIEVSQSSQDKFKQLQSQLEVAYNLQLAAKSSQMKELEEKLAAKSKEVKKQREELDSEKQAAEASKTNFDLELKAAIEAKESFETNLRMANQKAKDSKDQYCADLVALKKRCDETEQTIMDLKKAYAEEKQDLMAKQMDALESLKKSIQEAQDAKISRMKSYYEHQVQQEKSSQEKTLSELRSCQSSLKEAQETHKSALKKVEEVMVAKEGEILNLQQSCQAAEQSRNSLKQELEEERQALDHTSKNLLNKLAELFSAQAVQDFQNNKITSLESQLVELQSKQPINHVWTQTENTNESISLKLETLESALIEANSETLAIKTQLAEAKTRHSSDKAKLLEKLALVEQELARQRSQIMEKLLDIKSLRMSREHEMENFRTSVEEFNRQLEEERARFNFQLQELDQQKRLQFDMLNQKVKELEAQRDRERTLFQAFQSEQDEDRDRIGETEKYNKKDAAINQMIEQYKDQLERLKAENADLKSENLEAIKSIREFLSRNDPEENPEKMIGFRLPDALDKLSKRISRSDLNGVTFNHRSGLLRTQSVLNEEDRFNDTLGSEFQSGYNRPSTTNDLTLQEQDRTKMTLSATSSPLKKKKGIHASKVSEALEESDNDSDQSPVLHSSDNKLELERDQTKRLEAPRITIYKENLKCSFKLGRAITELPTIKRQFKPKIAEVTSLKEAKNRIKQNVDICPIILGRGRVHPIYLEGAEIFSLSKAGLLIYGASFLETAQLDCHGNIEKMFYQDLQSSRLILTKVIQS